MSSEQTMVSTAMSIPVSSVSMSETVESVTEQAMETMSSVMTHPVVASVVTTVVRVASFVGNAVAVVVTICGGDVSVVVPHAVSITIIVMNSINFPVLVTPVMTPVVSMSVGKGGQSVAMSMSMAVAMSTVANVSRHDHHAQGGEEGTSELGHDDEGGGWGTTGHGPWTGGRER
jgi:hypothetical protein